MITPSYLIQHSLQIPSTNSSQLLTILLISLFCPNELDNISRINMTSHEELDCIVNLKDKKTSDMMGVSTNLI
jgi:hypothetical protein